MEMKKAWVVQAIIVAATLITSDVYGEVESAIKLPVTHPEEESITEGEIQLQNHKVPYKTVAGTYNFKDAHGTVKGSFFYIAYTRTDVENTRTRPITFCFNGGPGASSVWMHMGLLGPKRVILNKDFSNAPPYSFGDNEQTLLDVTDLVFIDPISTGYSRTPQGEDPKQFYNVEEDIKSVGEFVRLYTTRNSRWESPKFLIGASYGTMRAVELSSHLFDEFNMVVNGVMLISSILDFQTIDTLERINDLACIAYLPTYTAVAWYHKLLSPELQADLPKALDRARNYALNEYALALLQGDNLTIERRKEVAQKLAYYSGISSDYIERTNLRISPYNYSKELLAKENKVVGRFDARLLGGSVNALAEYSGYDPSMDAIFSAFTGAFNEYVRKDLKWAKDDEYRVLADVRPWNYGKAMNRYVNAVPTLREVLIRLPGFSVFVASGYFDLATPFFGSEYSFSHLNVDKKIRDRVTMKYYPIGHMMYVDLPSQGSLSVDLHAFINSSIAVRKQ
jgi:carboxypeptidase C (cathepsin A)